MTQKEMPIFGQTKPLEMLPIQWIRKCSSRHQAIQLCVKASGLEYSYIADRLGIDRGQFTRIMGGSAHFPDKKEDELMQVCGNYAPMQYSADRHGFDLSLRSSDRQIAALQEQVNALREQSGVAA